MYGVIFILEELKINKIIEDKKIQTDFTEKNLNRIENNIKIEGNKSNIVLTDITSNNKIIDEKEETLDENNKLKENITINISEKEKNLIRLEEDLKENNLKDSSYLLEAINLRTLNEDGITEQENSLSLSSKQFNLYGPLIGQITGTVKDCCRKAYLNSEPRLYEALYLCTFQIKIESIGKIHSVINKRRGKV